MSFRRVTLTISGDDADRIADALLAGGALSVDLADADAGTADEQPAFDEPGESATRWHRCLVSALFSSDTNLQALLPRAFAHAGMSSSPKVEVDRVEDQDWVRLTRDQFKPIRISPRLWIVPSWLNTPDPSAINIRVDPGLAFGTGSHPTTRLCLQWLDAHLCPGARALDYGCGSGILAIAALRLGAAHAVGVDIDPQALVAARDNAMQNDVAAVFHLPGDDRDTGYHVVLANILANPLVTLAPLLAAKTVAGGCVVLSGILAEQAAAVSRTYSEWYDMEMPLVAEGWALLVGRRAADRAP